MKTFSHIENTQPSMVDVGDKKVTKRTAIAECTVTLPDEVANHVANGEIATLKGPVFQTAIIAGIQGAKRTSELIPLCHNIVLNKVQLIIEMVDHKTARIRCTAKCTGTTGVEMEALTGASIAALTIYDMCKALSHDIVISNIRLIEKSGGKSDLRLS